MHVSRCRDAVLLHGLWAGWTTVLLLAGTELIRLTVLVPPHGIVSACASTGYPKQADYFWYVAMLVGGIAGAFLNAMLARVMHGRCPRRPWPVPTGLVCAAAATAHGLRMHDPASWPAWTLLAAGWVLPWFDSDWFTSADESAPGADAPLLRVPPPWVLRPQDAGPKAGPPVPRWGWAVAAAGVAVVWIHDSCLPYRPIDGLHEGGQLTYVQSWLAGDLPGLETHVQYGPLYAHTLAWWTNAFGPTLSAARGYFLAAQMLGTAVHLWLLRATVRRPLPLAVGIWLMLTLTTAPNIQYGWGNALRTALPLAALWLAWRKRHAASGALAALGWLYSQEYGMAGCAGCALMVVMESTGTGARSVVRHAGTWMAGAVAATALALVIMFGPHAATAAAQLGGGGYALARLWGHSVSPLPAFPWWESWPQLFSQRRVLLELAAIWGPGMLAVAIAVRLPRWRRHPAARAGWLGGLVVFTVLAQVPVLARPLWQIATAIPAAILLGMAAADMLMEERPATNRATVVGLAAVAAYGLAIFIPMAVALTSKAACIGMATGRLPSPSLARLGSVRVAGEAASELATLVEEIQVRVPPGGRVYLAAPRYAHACFLAGRAPLPPYALTYLAATRDERLAIVAALELQPPPLAVITDAGLELPYRMEHPEEWAWLTARYRLDIRIGEVQLWVPLESAIRLATPPNSK